MSRTKRSLTAGKEDETAMETEILVQKWISPAFIIIGLSHLLQAAGWVDAFAELRKTRFAHFIIALYTLPIGLVLVAGHNKWEWGWPLVLTIGGWAMTIKSAVYLLVPSVTDRFLAGPAKSPASYRIGGLIMLAFGSILTWQAYFE